jgi:hypothetical protein
MNHVMMFASVREELRQGFLTDLLRPFSDFFILIAVQNA